MASPRVTSPLFHVNPSCCLTEPTRSAPTDQGRVSGKWAGRQLVRAATHRVSRETCALYTLSSYQRLRGSALRVGSRGSMRTPSDTWRLRLVSCKDSVGRRFPVTHLRWRQTGHSDNSDSRETASCRDDGRGNSEMGPVVLNATMGAIEMTSSILFPFPSIAPRSPHPMLSLRSP